MRHCVRLVLGCDSLRGQGGQRGVRHCVSGC